MHIDIEALGGQGDIVQGGTLLVAFRGGGLGCSLSLFLGGNGGLGNAYNGLLFFVTGNDRNAQEQGHGRESPDF
jgi:hypothetical protein